MTFEQDQVELVRVISCLKQDHNDFDSAINAMIAQGCDSLQIQRMKKKKLAIKDLLQKLQDQIIPNIIA